MSRKVILDPGIKVRKQISDTLYGIACERELEPQQIIEEVAAKFNVSNYLTKQIFWELVAQHVIGEDVARGWNTSHWPNKPSN